MCEVAPADVLYKDPSHHYTSALLNAIPVPDPTVIPDPDTRIKGELPSPLVPALRLPVPHPLPAAQERCAAEEPQLRDLGGGHYVACHFPIGHAEAPPAAVNGYAEATAGSEGRLTGPRVPGGDDGTAEPHPHATRPDATPGPDRRRHRRGAARARPGGGDLRGDRRRRRRVPGAALQLLRRPPGADGGAGAPQPRRPGRDHRRRRAGRDDASRGAGGLGPGAPRRGLARPCRLPPAGVAARAGRARCRPTRASPSALRWPPTRSPS